jgi:RNA polymerase sigma-70 factor, ECF subfamily
VRKARGGGVADLKHDPVTEAPRTSQTLAMDGSLSRPLPLPRAPSAEAAGPTPALQDIYRAHFGYVWRSLARLGVRDADIADLAHDVFVVVHRKLDDFDPRRPLKPWLFGICFRVALDKKRKASSHRETLTDDPRAASSVPTSEELVAARQAHDQVMRALDHLDEQKRAVFVMHELEGLSMPEIAEIVDVPLNTLYSRLRVAREAFVAAVRADARPMRTRGGAR